MSGRHNLPFFIPHEGCPHRCSFCDQNAISGAQRGPSPREVAERCDALLPAPGAGGQFEIAFFGGSFTAIAREQMVALLEAAFPFVQAGRAAGIRISTRPDAVDDEILDLLAAYRVTAIELGAQSMDDRVLAANGRGHTAQQTRAAAASIRARGFSLGLQMMVGLPGEGDPVRAAAENAAALAALCPDTMRIYPVLVLCNTPLEVMARKGSYQPLTVEQAVRASAPLLEYFEQKGIRVIRVGLQDDGALRRHLIAGPYHPAFRQCCESFLFRRRMGNVLQGVLPGDYRLLVAPGRISDAVGQRRENLRAFAQRGYRLTITDSCALTGREVRLYGTRQREECEAITCF